MTSLTDIFSPLASSNLLEWFQDLNQLWHETGPIAPEDRQASKGMTQWIHYHNYCLWHEEDEARRSDVPDAYIVRAKRDIDKHNQQRNDGIEKVDVWIDNVLSTAGIQPDEQVELNSETPGAIIDRLSILTLKIYHMEEQKERPDLSDDLRNLCDLRRSILHEQINDLARALDKLFLDLRQVKKRHKVYRQFKMYNDPRFNPAVYLHRRDDLN